jgi:ABC-type uncharacterized transport system permease subunit
MKRDFIYLIIIVAGLFIWWQHSLNEYRIVKEKEEIVKQAKIDFSKSTDSLLIINKDLKTKLELEKNKPPVTIPKYYEKIIYIDVNDSTIIKSVTKSTKRYREKRQ